MMDPEVKVEVEKIRKSLKRLEQISLSRVDVNRRAARKYKEWCEHSLRDIPRIDRTASKASSEIEYHLRGIERIFRQSSEMLPYKKSDPLYDWCRRIELKMRELGTMKAQEELFPEQSGPRGKRNE